MVVLAVDPGTRGAGCALFRNGVLIAAAYVKNPVTFGNQVAACVAMATAVWEWTRVVLGLPAAGPVPAVWRWLVATFPAASAWLTSLLGVDPAVVELPGVVVCEWPRMYLGDRQKGDQNDLPPLAGVDCAIGAMFHGAELISVHPDVWKSGQVPKKVMNDRVWERLTEKEQAVVQRLPRGGMSHDALDGVGVGLWYLGRLKRRRNFG